MIIVVVFEESSKWSSLSVSTPSDDWAKLFSWARDYEKSFCAKFVNLGSKAYSSIGSVNFFYY